LKIVEFFADSTVREIHGINSCTSPERIEIPKSVEFRDQYRFYGRCSPKEVIFEANSLLREIGGSDECSWLERVVGSASAQTITSLLRRLH
jgi:hypothetical protein